ncbi:hypothetical protein D3C71_1844190 [compost metagenome]
MFLTEPGTQQRSGRRLDTGQRTGALEHRCNLAWRADQGGAGQCLDRRADLGSGQPEEPLPPSLLDFQQSAAEQTSQVGVGR